MALIAGCESEGTQQSEAGLGSPLLNVCRFLSPEEAEAALRAVVSESEQSPNPDGTVDTKVCTYSGDDEVVAGLGLVPTVSVTVTKGGASTLPPNGSLLNASTIARYPALGAPAGSESPQAVIHRGEVAGKPTVWYTRPVDPDEDDGTTFTTLNLSSGEFGIFVGVSATPDDVAAAKRVAATVQRNLDASKT